MHNALSLFEINGAQPPLPCPAMSPNGAAAEEICQSQGQRLVTLAKHWQEAVNDGPG